MNNVGVVVKKRFREDESIAENLIYFQSWLDGMLSQLNFRTKLSLEFRLFNIITENKSILIKAIVRIEFLIHFDFVGVAEAYEKIVKNLHKGNAKICWGGWCRDLSNSDVRKRMNVFPNVFVDWNREISLKDNKRLEKMHADLCRRRQLYIDAIHKWEFLSHIGFSELINDIKNVKEDLINLDASIKDGNFITYENDAAQFAKMLLKFLGLSENTVYFY